MFNESTLVQVENTIEKSIKVDMAPTALSRGKFARVYVELNLNQPLIPTICVMRRIRSIEYEGLYKVCFFCRKFGHKADQCYHVKSGESNPQATTNPKPPIQTTSIAENPYGSCLLMLGAGCNRHMPRWIRRVCHLR